MSKVTIAKQLYKKVIQNKTTDKMSGADKWIECPLEIIQSLFDENRNDLAQSVKDFFTKRVEEKDNIHWIPSLNDTPLHHLKTNTLVKYRCMIQDMFDPEFYLGIYEVEDVNTGDKSFKNGKYRDLADCKPHEKINMESANSVTLDRQTLYCVPVPGENSWVKESFAGMNKQPISNETKHTGGSTGCKRTLEEDENEVEMVAESQSGSSVQTNEKNTNTTDEGDSKKSKTSTKSESSKTSMPDLNFPLPNETGPACLVKHYESGDAFKLNDVVEFIGVLSNDPAMVTFTEGKRDTEKSAFMDPAEDTMEGVEEQNVHSPPPSLVPRLHAITARQLHHVNPLLPADVNAEENKTVTESLMKEAKDLRENIVSVLSQALCGDELAAEYVLCHLISSVYARQDVVSLGKFALNISGCPTDSNFSSLFYDVIQALVTKSFFLPMTLNNLNFKKFTPKKDYTANRLTSGMLQLSDNTELVLDETALQAGQLDPNGVKNITAIGHMIKWQKLEYDFNFHLQDFQTNISVMVLSEGKSMLPCDCQIQLSPDGAVGDLEQRYEAIKSYLTPALLTRIRTYLDILKLLPYSLPEDVQKVIEEDFVDMRKHDPQGISIDSFHNLLILARLLSLSYGCTSLSRDTWEKTKVLEHNRKARLTTNARNN